jgi:hypothetical protein
MTATQLDSWKPGLEPLEASGHATGHRVSLAVREGADIASRHIPLSKLRLGRWVLPAQLPDHADGTDRRVVLGPAGRQVRRPSRPPDRASERPHRQGGFGHEAGFVLGQGTKPTLVIGP